MRDEANRIIEVSLEKSRTSNLLRAGFAAGATVVMTLFAITEASRPGYHGAEKLVVIAAALAVLTLAFMKTALKGQTSAGVIAAGDGVRFSRYPELGMVPWRAISSIHTELPFRMSHGGAMGVAKLKASDDFERMLNPDNASAPGKPLAPTFATIATSETVDLQVLSTALAEYLEQERQAPPPSVPAQNLA